MFSYHRNDRLNNKVYQSYFAMKYIFPLLLLIITCAGLISCDDEKNLEPTEVAIFVNPPLSRVDTVTSGTHLAFTIEMYSKSSQINRLQVVELSPNGVRNIVDETFSENTRDYLLDYVAPQFDNATDSAKVTLRMTAWDKAGASNKVERYVIVKNSKVLVGEYTGIVLHRGEDGLNDAINLGDPTQTFRSAKYPDDVDLKIVADENYQNVSFISNTQTRFVRYNDFNYSAATVSSIQNIFDSSKLQYQIDDIRINDIIIVGHERAQGVFFVSNIVRSGSPEEKSVQLSYKMVSPK